MISVYPHIFWCGNRQCATDGKTKLATHRDITHWFVSCRAESSRSRLGLFKPEVAIFGGAGGRVWRRARPATPATCTHWTALAVNHTASTPQWVLWFIVISIFYSKGNHNVQNEHQPVESPSPGHRENTSLSAWNLYSLIGQGVIQSMIEIVVCKIKNK